MRQILAEPNMFTSDCLKHIPALLSPVQAGWKSQNNDFMISLVFLNGKLDKDKKTKGQQQYNSLQPGNPIESAWIDFSHLVNALAAWLLRGTLQPPSLQPVAFCGKTT